MVAPANNFAGGNDSDGKDIFAPPAIATEVTCFHCGEVFDSYLIEWREGAGPPGDPGAWCCPTPGCDGIGFLFDIWPIDPEWRDENGETVCCFDEDDDDDAGDPGFDNPDDFRLIEDDDEHESSRDEPFWGGMDDIPHDMQPPPPRRRPDDRPETDFNDDDIPF